MCVEKKPLRVIWKRENYNTTAVEEYNSILCTARDHGIIIRCVSVVSVREPSNK